MIIELRKQKDIDRLVKNEINIHGTIYNEDYKSVTKERVYESIYNGEYEIINHLHGQYWGVVETHTKWIIFSDRFGISHPYYYKDNDRIIVSDNIDDIVQSLSKKLEINFEAWAEFLTFHYILGNKTYFKEIKTLYDGYVLAIDKQTGEEQYISTGDKRYIEQESLKISKDEAVEKIIEHLRRIIKGINQHISKPMMVTLSGGWDSRLIASVVSKLNIPFRTITSYYDNGNNKEEIYAKLVSDYLKVENEFIDLDREYFLDGIEDYLKLTDYSTSLHVWLRHFFNKITNKEVVNLDGLAGDIFLRGLLNNYLQKDRVQEEDLEGLFEVYRNSKNFSIATYVGVSLINELAYKGFKEEFKRLGYSQLLFALENRNRRNISYSIKIQSQYITVFCPFLDNQFVDFILSLPEEIRRDTDFYPAILRCVSKVVADIPSTNDKNQPKIWDKKKIFRYNVENIKIYLQDLNVHFTDVEGIYSPNRVCNVINDQLLTLQAPLNVLREIEHIWFYKKWKMKYENQLISKSLNEYINKWLEDNRYKKYRSIMNQPMSDKRESMKKWRKFIDKNLEHTHQLNVLMTMDVEGYGVNDIESYHTSNGNYLSNLIYGQFEEERANFAQGSTLRNVIDNFDVPITFFTEIYSDIFATRQEKIQLLRDLNQGKHEVALHSHPFSLSKVMLEEIGIKIEDYKREEGFKKILSYGVNLFIEAFGYGPISYRAGRFEAYKGHFEALRQCGFRVDSSLYLNNPLNYTGKCKEIKNNCENIGGILEVPVTSFYTGKNNRVNRFDFNSLSFDEKLELLAKSLVYDNRIVMMLMHSWSFSDIYNLGNIQKGFHYRVSEEAVEQFRYLAEFLHSMDAFNLITCKELSKQYSRENESDKCYGGLCDLNGKEEKDKVYYNPPEFGTQREKPLDGFIDCTNGKFSSNEEGDLGKVEPYKIELVLPRKKQPFKGDFTTYAIELDTIEGQIYHLTYIVEAPYYNAKYVGRNNIRYSIWINEYLCHYNFITQQKDISKPNTVFRATSSKTILKFKVECLCDEQPWGWGSCAKTQFKYIHIMKGETKEINPILGRNLLSNFQAVTENIELNNKYNTTLEIRYRKKQEQNNYIQLFSGNFNSGPNMMIEPYCILRPMQELVLTFGMNSNYKELRAYIFLIQYDENGKVESLNQEIKVDTTLKYYSLQYMINKNATRYKVAIKFMCSEAEELIILEDFQVHYI